LGWSFPGAKTTPIGGLVVKVPKGTAKGKVKVTVKTPAGRSAAKGFKRLQDAKRHHAHAFEPDRRRPSPSMAKVASIRGISLEGAGGEVA
jgi:hypothetical protein